jgi:UDP-N-acetylmuramate--alanine ligase
LFKNFKKIHFVGIGGIGMSGIAEILLSQGFKISGSDKSLSEITQRLSELGVEIYEGHSRDNLKDVDVLVYSSAVSLDNPEIQAAIDRKIPVIKRAEMLAECMRMKYGIGIAGTHGKTTTTSMIGLTLTEGELDPTIIVGGKISGLGGTNARLGNGEFIVVEADEFDRTFLKLTPTIAILTTLEKEHLDTYKDLEDIKTAFVEFANKTPFYGFVVLCLDEPALQDIMPLINKKIITYGTNPNADIKAINIKHDGFFSEYEVLRYEESLGKFKLRVPGLHNVKNSLAAIAVAYELGVDLEVIRKSLEKFTGVYRRFEVKYNDDKFLVIDDYAHHPTEAAAVLSAIRSGWNRRVVAVFQPHLYSRTRDFYQEFARVFLNSDVFVCLDVYPAREEPLPGINGELIANTAKKFGHKKTFYEPDKTKLPDLLMELKNEGDIIVTMGAGDVWKYGEQFVEKLKQEK